MGIAAAAVAVALLVPAARGDDEPWIIEAGPEAAGAVKAGAATVAKAQKLAKKKKYLEAVDLLEGAARQWPAAVHDCNLSLAYLRAGALTRAQLMWDVAGLRNADRPTWCTADLSGQLSTALRAAGFVPLTITVTPPDAIVEVGGVTVRGLHVVWLPSGSHVVAARAGGRVDGRAEIVLSEGNASVSIALEEPAREVDAGVVAVDTPLPADAGVVDVPQHPAELPERTARRARWPGWAGLGTGAVLIGAGAFFHARAIDARDDGNAVFVADPAFAEAEARFSRERTRALVSYAVGVAAAGFGTWWLLRAEVAVTPERAVVTIGGDW